ncbi:MAG: hypothetical protein ACUVV6_02165 [Thermoplasmatota archaeon]
MRLREERVVALLAARGVAWVGGAEPPPSEPGGSLLAALDPASHKIILLLTGRGVREWRALLESQPRDVAREYLEPGERAESHLGRELARRAGFQGADQTRLERLVVAAHGALVELDALWVDLRFRRSGEGFGVWRAEVELDDEALFRHPELQGALEAAPNFQPGRPTERERAALEAGVKYIELDGDIGLLPGGMSFALAALDIVRSVGGSPANLMDSGGEVSAERLRAMMDILMDDPRVTTVFGCRWAGLTRAEDWAGAMVRYILERRPTKPIVLRLAGSGEAEARRIFEEAAERSPEEFRRVWVFYSNTPVDNAAREAVALADMLRRGENPFESEGESAGRSDGPEGGRSDGGESRGAGRV